MATPSSMPWKTATTEAILAIDIHHCSLKKVSHAI